MRGGTKAVPSQAGIVAAVLHPDWRDVEMTDDVISGVKVAAQDVASPRQESSAVQ